MADKLTKEDLSDISVNAGVLEELFGVGDRMIRYLVEQGVVEKVSRGKYGLMKSVKNYITTIKVASQGKIESEGELDLDEERAKHEHVKRQITEIKLQLIRGETHKAEDVEAVMTDMFQKFKAKMESMPAKLAKKLEGEERIEIQKILKSEIEGALNELAAYNPENFYSDEHIDVSDDAVNELLEGVMHEGKEGG
jgi:phage terminase Nu1 subunit (DNA packaging protein)